MPGVWTDVFLLSAPVAAVAATLYHASNACRLALARRHLSPIAGVMIVATPYVVGSLVLLESTDLLERLAGGMTAGLLAGWPAVVETFGAMLVVFGFNEAVAHGIALATGRRGVRAAQTHLWLAATAAAVVVAPWIADLGSGALAASLPSPVRWFAVVLTTVLSQAALWAEVYLITGLVLDGIRGQGPSAKSVGTHPVQGIRKGWSSAESSWGSSMGSTGWPMRRVPLRRSPGIRS